MNKNRLLMTIGLVALAALFAWGLYTPATEVDLATIRRGPLAVTVNEEGRTRIREIYTVSAPVSGLLRRLSLREGDRVRKGKTVVAVIEPLAPAFQDVRSLNVLRANIKSAEAALALAKAELSRVEADHEYAVSDFRRTARLYKKRIVARKIYDQSAAARRKAKAAVDAARARVEVRRKELESVRAQLLQPAGNHRKKKKTASCCLSLTSPADGRVLAIRHKSEQVVTAGTPLLDIGNDRDLEIVIDLLSSDAVRVHPGAHAMIDGWGGEKALPARVRHIEPAGFTKVSALGIEEQRVRTILDLLPAGDRIPRLGHEFRVYAHINVWEGKNPVLVPLPALFRKGNDWVVFIEQNGRARLKKIKINHRNQQFAEVTDGLVSGDRVILHPSDLIVDGTAITARRMTK